VGSGARGGALGTGSQTGTREAALGYGVGTSNFSLIRLVRDDEEEISGGVDAMAKYGIARTSGGTGFVRPTGRARAAHGGRAAASLSSGRARGERRAVGCSFGPDPRADRLS